MWCAYLYGNLLIIGHWSISKDVSMTVLVFWSAGNCSSIRQSDVPTDHSVEGDRCWMIMFNHICKLRIAKVETSKKKKKSLNIYLNIYHRNGHWYNSRLVELARSPFTCDSWAGRADTEGGVRGRGGMMRVGATVEDEARGRRDVRCSDGSGMFGF